MKIFVGDKLYDSEKDPLVIIFEPIERLEIQAMPPKANYMISIPDHFDEAIEGPRLMQALNKVMEEAGEEEPPPPSDQDK